MNNKPLTASNPYTRMQQAKYNNLAEIDNRYQGWRKGEPRSFMIQLLEAHNNWSDYETYLWKDIPDLHSKDVLDFGCGPGRNLIKYHNKFRSIDGVDLSALNLETARQWITTNNLDVNKFTLYKNNGVDLDVIPSNRYDVIMSTICLQHISVYEIRYNLLKEFFRVLRPNGYVTLQFLLNSEKPGTVKYFDNNYDAHDTNGGADCTVDNPRCVEFDLWSLGFVDFKYYIRPSIEVMGGKISNMTDNEWLFVNARKSE